MHEIKLDHVAAMKATRSYVRSLKETDEEREAILNNEANRKRIQHLNRDLVNCLIYLPF